VQKDIGVSAGDTFWLNLSGKAFVLVNNKWTLVDVPGVIDDETKWNLFAYSMQATGEPQLVIIKSSAGHGHAMICYRIDQGNLYIADPNYPGNTGRRIAYANGAFQPYNSGANKADIDAGNGEVYETILYSAKSTVLPWDNLTQRWNEFKNNSIGNGNGLFPAYTLVYVDDAGKTHELQDGYVSPGDSMTIWSAFALTNEQVEVFNEDGTPWPLNDTLHPVLSAGENHLGIYVKKQTVVNGQIADEYVDFRHINVIYNATTTALPSGVSIFSMDLTGTFLYTGQSSASEPSDQEDDTFGIPWVRGSEGDEGASMDITWSGTSFSGSISNEDDSDGSTSSQEQLSGSISADGKTLLSLDYSYNYTYVPSDTKYDWTINEVASSRILPGTSVPQVFIRCSGRRRAPS
jgi:hypothetical protein